jgi:hypothetical protein
MGASAFWRRREVTHLLRYRSDRRASFYCVLRVEPGTEIVPQDVLDRAPQMARGGGSTLPLHIWPLNATCTRLFGVLGFVFVGAIEFILIGLKLADTRVELADQCFRSGEGRLFAFLTTVHLISVWSFLFGSLGIVAITVRANWRGLLRLLAFYFATNTMHTVVSAALLVSSITVKVMGPTVPYPNYLVSGSMGLACAPIVFPLVDLAALNFQGSRAVPGVVAYWLFTLIRYFVTSLIVQHECVAVENAEGSGSSGSESSSGPTDAAGVFSKVVASLFVTTMGATIVQSIPLIRTKVINPSHGLVRLATGPLFVTVEKCNSDGKHCSSGSAFSPTSSSSRANNNSTLRDDLDVPLI